MRIIATYENPKFCTLADIDNYETKSNFDGFETATIYASSLMDLKQQVSSTKLQRAYVKSSSRPLKLSDLTIRIKD
jgi:hypothetical protein